MIKMFIFVAEKKEPRHPIVSRLDFLLSKKKQKEIDFISSFLINLSKFKKND